MRQSRGQRPVTIGGSRTVSGGFAMMAVSVAAIGLLAGCHGSGSPGAVAATTSGAPTASPVNSAAASPAASAAVAFVPVTELFDPGHPAHAMSASASCGDQDTTVAIEQCFEAKTETADAAIDATRQASFAGAAATQRAAINADDSGWLAARRTVCATAYQTGGTIDGINIAACLLDESTARLDALKGVTPPEAVLKSTDSTNLSDLFWYTTPGGSRIAMIDTQGDAAGGAVIAWVIIAGADGFAVNPAQFSYRDGAFTDAGTVQGPDVSGHRVAPGTEYQFSIDYSHLPAAPHGSTGGWVYAPGTPVAVWR
jgi:uncharacterized protein YecT (DUF1311 family)